MANNSQDYYFRMFAELYGKENIQAITAGIGEAAAAAKRAKQETDTWTRAMEIAADKAGVSVKQLTAQIREKIREQERDKKSVQEYEGLVRKASEEAQRAAKAEAAEMRKAADEAKALARARLEAWLAGQGRTSAGGAAGGRGGIAGGTDSLLGRVGGRVFGAEFGTLAGIPGGGFIGSQLAQGVGAGGALLGVGLGAYALTEIGKYIDQTAKWAQEQRNLAREVGVTTGQMAALNTASEILGVNTASAVKAVNNLGTELYQGGARAKEIEQALKALGLSMETAFKTTDEALKDVVTALGKVHDDGARTRLAVDLLGESGRALAAVFRDMPELIGKITVDNDALERFAKLRDMTGEIGAGFREMVAEMADFFGKVLLKEPQPKRPDPFKAATKGMVGALDVEGGATVDITGALDVDASKIVGVPALKARNFEYQREYAKTHGTMEDRFQGKITDITRRRDALKKELEQLRVTPEMYAERMEDLAVEEKSARDQYRYEQQVRSQFDSFRKLRGEILEGPADLFAMMKQMRSPSFGLINQTPEFQAYRDKLTREAITPMEIGGKQVRSPLQALTFAGMGFDPATGRFKFQDEAFEESMQRARRRFELTMTERQHQDQRTAMAAGVLNVDVAQEARQRQVIAQQITESLAGFSRYGLTGQQIGQIEYGQSISALEREYAPQVYSLRNRGQRLAVAAGMMSQGSDERIRAQEEADQLLLDAENKEIEAKTKSIEVTNRFNESMDSLASRIRDQFSSSAVSIMLGAQRGARVGRGGEGAATAAIAFGEGLEARVLQNILGRLVYGDPQKRGSGGNIISNIGKSLPPWLTQGTIFEPIGGKKQNPELDLNTKSHDRNSIAVDRLTNAIVSSKITYAGSGILGMGNGIGLGDAFPGIGNVTGDVNSGTGYPLTGISGAGNWGDGTYVPPMINGVPMRSNVVSDALSSFGLGASKGGLQSIGILTGKVGSTTGVKIGAAAADVGLGLAAYHGISTALKGDAKNISAGIGETLGAVAPFTGPAAPFVAGAAAIAGLVSAFLPDNRVRRAHEIEKKMFTSQYLAPEAINMTRGTNGGFLDTDYMGNVRTSNLSPYPQTHQAYLDVPRRTVAPGDTFSQFGGPNNVTSALTPPPTMNLTINALDARSIKERGADIADAVHSAVKGGHHPLINEVGQQLGIR